MTIQNDFQTDSFREPADNAVVSATNADVDPLLPLAISYIYWLKDVKYPAHHCGKRLSIPTVAKMTGFSVHTINNFLYGKTDDPHFFKLARIIGVLGGSVDELIGIGAYSVPWKRPETYAPAVSNVAPPADVHPSDVPPSDPPIIQTIIAPCDPPSVPAPAASHDDDPRDLFSLPVWQRPFVRRQRDSRRNESSILASRDPGTLAALLSEVAHLRRTNSGLLFALVVFSALAILFL